MQEIASQPATVHFQRDGLLQVALCDRADGSCNLCRGTRQVVEQEVKGFEFIRPASNEPARCKPLLQTAFLPDHPGNIGCLPRAPLAHRHNLVEGFGDPPPYTVPF